MPIQVREGITDLGLYNFSSSLMIGVVSVLQTFKLFSSLKTNVGKSTALGGSILSNERL